MNIEKLNNLIIMINILKFYVKLDNTDEALDLLDTMLKYINELRKEMI